MTSTIKINSINPGNLKALKSTTYYKSFAKLNQYIEYTYMKKMMFTKNKKERTELLYFQKKRNKVSIYSLIDCVK